VVVDERRGSAHSGMGTMALVLFQPAHGRSKYWRYFGCSQACVSPPPAAVAARSQPHQPSAHGAWHI
jgi:hypothetical protein